MKAKILADLQICISVPLRFKLKPWITPALQKSITVKNSLLKKFINCNDSQTKEYLHTRYKEYKNLLSILLKRSRTNYYNHYFDINWNNIKNTWKEIKAILSIKLNQKFYIQMIVLSQTQLRLLMVSTIIFLALLLKLK